MNKLYERELKKQMKRDNEELKERAKFYKPLRIEALREKVKQDKLQYKDVDDTTYLDAIESDIIEDLIFLELVLAKVKGENEDLKEPVIIGTQVEDNLNYYGDYEITIRKIEENN